MTNTNDLSKFGFIELKEASKLLSAYIKDNSMVGDNVKIEFNMNSGCVFLVDDDYRVFMQDEGSLYEFFTCSECGHEGDITAFENTDCDGCEEIYQISSMEDLK